MKGSSFAIHLVYLGNEATCLQIADMQVQHAIKSQQLLNPRLNHAIVNSLLRD